MEESFNKMDLSGKLIIKARFGEDIRRIPIHNDDLTYDELVLMMQRVFKGSITPDDELLLKYKDEDGDLITITDNSDLSFAIQYCRVLKLTILSGNQEQKTGSVLPSLDQLRSIRDAINKLLDSCVDSGSAPIQVVEETGEPDSSISLNKEVSSAFNGFKEQSREFDPLNQEQTNQALKADSDYRSESRASSAQDSSDTTPSYPSQPAPSQPSSQQSFSAPGQHSAYPAAQAGQPTYPGQPAYSAAQPGYSSSQPGYTPAQSSYPSSQPAYNVGYPAGQPQTGQTPNHGQVAMPTPFTGQSGDPGLAKPYPTAQRPVQPPGATQQQQQQQPQQLQQQYPGFPGVGATGQQQPAYSAPGYTSAGPAAYSGYPGYTPTSAPSNPYSRATPGAGYAHPQQTQPGYK